MWVLVAFAACPTGTPTFVQLGYKFYLDREILFRIKPDSSLNINSHGYRGKDFKKEKESDEASTIKGQLEKDERKNKHQEKQMDDLKMSI